MQRLLLIASGGALGALARYFVWSLLQGRSASPFPIGTRAVNALGCLLMGVLVALVETRVDLHPELRFLLGVGFLGSFTTFSSLGHETIELLRQGSFALALASVALNLLLGLAAILAGRAVVLFALP
jgi:CrcB protein